MFECDLDLTTSHTVYVDRLYLSMEPAIILIYDRRCRMDEEAMVIHDGAVESGIDAGVEL